MAIDVVFLDAGGGVLEVRRGLRPWRVARCRGAAAVLECPAGGAEVLLSGRSSRAATAGLTRKIGFLPLLNTPVAGVTA